MHDTRQLAAGPGDAGVMREKGISLVRQLDRSCPVMGTYLLDGVFHPRRGEGGALTISSPHGALPGVFQPLHHDLLGEELPDAETGGLPHFNPLPL